MLRIAREFVPGVRSIVINGHTGPEPDAPALGDALWLIKPISRDRLLAGVGALVCLPGAPHHHTGT